MKELLTARAPYAGWCLAHAAMTRASGLLRFGMEVPFYGAPIVDASWLFVRSAADRLETPWIVVELIAAIPNHKRVVVEHAARALEGFGDRALAPIEHGLRRGGAHRGPYEHRNEAFYVLHAPLVANLGLVLAADDFTQIVPTADGKRMKRA